MLVQFTVENYKSFKGSVDLSMVCAPINEMYEDNTFIINDKLALLKSAVMYGANASGKSNLLSAMAFVKGFVFNSSTDSQIDKEINTSFFELNSLSCRGPSRFEIIFIHENIRYRYGFVVDKKKVWAEWLFYVPNKQEIEVFTRDEQTFKLSRHFKEGRMFVKEDKIRPNALLLSISAQFNGVIAVKLLEWFSKKFHVLSGLKPVPLKRFTCDYLMQDKKNKEIILEMLKNADMSIEDIVLNMPEILKKDDEQTKFKKSLIFEIQTLHKKYNNSGKVIDKIAFNMDESESKGTQKFFALLGPIIDTILNGNILVIDELDSRLHPKLVREICKLFNSKEKNSKNAQLIFASQNTNIMNKDIFRRDQIWFIEKDRYEASKLYSLAEYKEVDKKIRKDASYEKDYLRGRYGAVPYTVEFEVNDGEG